jgi:hypothetical protein
MAIAIDATSNGYTSAATSLTISHTVAGSNRVLVVGVSTQTTITGVTYNGVAMTLGVTGTNTFIYYLATPDTGTHDIVISLNASGWCQGYGTSLSGCKTASPLDVTGTASIGAGNAITKAVTTVYDNSYVFDNVTEYGSGTAFTVGAGQTQIANTQDATANRTRLGSYEKKTTAGSITMDWNTNSSGGAEIAVLSIREADKSSLQINII